MKKETSKIIIGRAEWFSFPTLGIPAIKARIDSGAKTSSIHAYHIKPFQRDGVDWVKFEVHPVQGNRRVVIDCESPIVDQRKVKSSSGTSEKRYVVRAPVTIGDRVWDIELTLTNRDSMGYRMLLGREAMIGRMMIDPEKSFCLGKVSDTKVKILYKVSNIKG